MKNEKPWSEYSEIEINREKKKWKLNHIFCNYSVINHKTRGCHPFECEHYKDKVKVSKVVGEEGSYRVQEVS